MMSNYFVMRGDGPTPAAFIAEEPDLLHSLWYKGAFITEPIPEPLRYELAADSPEVLKPLYDELGVPLIRKDLLDVLVAAGVDNLQTFPAVVIDPGTNEPHKDYSAFNVVGVVAAADMDQSRIHPNGDEQMTYEDDDDGERHLIDVDFDHLVVDESKANGLLLFRLAEAVTTIVVHASVRRKIEESGIEGIAFYGRDDEAQADTEADAEADTITLPDDAD